MSRFVPLLVLTSALFLAPRAGASRLYPGDAPPWALGETPARDLRVTLLTFGPGDEVASLFGHSALVVEDTAHHTTVVYNYGMFSFDRALLVRYAFGKLTFWLGEASFEGTLRLYQSEGRSILAQQLRLPPDALAELAGFLAWNARPENRGYLYDHFLDNCATRPRDVIDRFAAGRLHRQMARAARMSLRDNVRRYTAAQPAVALLLDFMMNSDIERPITVWDEAFLPEVLSDELAASGLAAPSMLLAPAVERGPTPNAPPRRLGGLLVLGAAVGGLGVLLAELARRRPALVSLFGLHQLVVGLALGVPGLVLALLWAVTEHRVAYANENLLLANPLTLLAAPLGAWLLVRPGARARRLLEPVWLSLALTSGFALLAKALPLFDQDNAPLLALLVPLNLATALTVVRLNQNLK
jgi:hypothetical protein